MDSAEQHLARVRRICAAFPETTEKISHGEPTFFVRKKVFVMFANNHHGDGHIAVWVPARAGAQAMLVSTWPEKFFCPAYVGVRGWIGIQLDGIDEAELLSHVNEAWGMVAPKKLRSAKG